MLIRTRPRVVASYFLNSPPDIALGFEGRAEMSVDLDAQRSTLQLKRVMMQDSRTFQCSVTIQGDDEGVSAATTSLLVIVAPSKPVCGIQGAAEYWNNISLTCVSEEGSPIPKYAWKSYSVQNVPRPNFPPHTTEKDGTLSLVNISMETSGFFVCTSTNRIGSESCNLTLSVLPTSRSIGGTVGVIGGVVAGIVILGIIIYCCCCRKEKQDKYDQGSPEVVEFEDQPSVRDQYLDDKSSSLTKPYIEESDHFEEKSVRDEGNYSGNQVVIMRTKMVKKVAMTTGVTTLVEVATDLMTKVAATMAAVIALTIAMMTFGEVAIDLTTNVTVTVAAATALTIVMMTFGEVATDLTTNVTVTVAAATALTITMTTSREAANGLT
ncbi:hypothetical protein CRUP_011379, partial [Coryphaenoides rupestris]